MPTTIYPANAAEVAAFLAAIVPLATWAIGGLIKGLNERAKGKEAEWLRLHEIATILYNENGHYGAWRQLLAAQELERLKGRRKEALILARSVSSYFRSIPDLGEGTQRTLVELDQFIAHYEPETSAP